MAPPLTAGHIRLGGESKQGQKVYFSDVLHSTASDRRSGAHYATPDVGLSAARTRHQWRGPAVTGSRTEGPSGPRGGEKWECLRDLQAKGWQQANATRNLGRTPKHWREA